MVRQLEQFKLFYNNKTYFVDTTLNQIRNVDNPHDYVNFPSGIELINALITCVNQHEGTYVN